MKRSLYILSLMLLAACTGKNIKIKGTFCGAEGKTVFLERVAVNGTKILDSATTTRSGYFSFGLELNSNEPTFYNLRCSGQVITLLLQPGETARVKALGNVARNYEVEGSEGSSLVQQLNTLIVSTSQQLDSLASIYRTSQDTTELRDVAMDINKIFIAQKRNSIKFVITHPNSLASLMALYQRLPGGVPIFGDTNDAVYFRMVADSLVRKYPASPHVIAMLRDVKAINSSSDMAEAMNIDGIREVSLPELELADMYGTKHKLSSLAGKVILIDFWASQIPDLNINNAELIETYNKYKDAGFCVYQISVDQSKPMWVNAVQQQGLPWISVCDFMGADSYAVRLYNIQKIPSNFLIDQNGNIVAKDLYGEKLETRLSEMFNK